MEKRETSANAQVYDDGKGTDVVSRASTRTGQQEGRFRERHPMGPQIGPF
jgi:hypothetical protein